MQNAVAHRKNRLKLLLMISIYNGILEKLINSKQLNIKIKLSPLVEILTKNGKMKYSLIVIFLFIITGAISQTTITDENFFQAIDTCLSTNPVDGLCYNCEYGSMPEWNVSNVTKMDSAF